MDENIPVCQFGKTEYNSRIFDNLYRTWGTIDGGIILSAYWKDELKCFKVEVPYSIIKELLIGRNIGALCYNYDWKEVPLSFFEKYTDLTNNEKGITVINIPYEPKPYFSKKLISKIKRRVLWLTILSFFGYKPSK